MNFQKLMDSLARFGRILPAVVADVSDEDARWKPESGNWSILEIVCHLADEETEDFRQRVKLTLEDPSSPWPPIDPEQACIDRKYNEQELDRTVERFVSQRIASVEWLRTIASPNWENAYVHPEFRAISAGEVMVSWAAHDQLHLRQIAKRMFEMNVRDGSPYATEYGGQWSA